ncbi:MAG TPA: hypothetical protein VMF50_07800 [Candidatus Binataceae bacterium]|nr:hypothetical protein [Candidatus Binataceae bacterium]
MGAGVAAGDAAVRLILLLGAIAFGTLVLISLRAPSITGIESRAKIIHFFFIYGFLKQVSTLFCAGILFDFSLLTSRWDSRPKALGHI